MAGGVKVIPLTRGMFATIDAEDHHFLSHFRWCLLTTANGRTFMAVKSFGRKLVLMHRLIMNAPDGCVVDHVNGNQLDNRRSNLRVCTVAENSRNRKRLNKRNTSGRHGVSWHAQTGKWNPAICANYRKRSLGLFDSIEDAVAARRAGERMYHGEFASGL